MTDRLAKVLSAGVMLYAPGNILELSLGLRMEFGRWIRNPELPAKDVVAQGMAYVETYSFGPLRLMRTRIPRTAWAIGGGFYFTTSSTRSELIFAPVYWKMWLRRNERRLSISIGPFRVASYSDAPGHVVA